MTDRRNILSALSAGIKTWSIGPDGISASGEADTSDLLRFMQEQPDAVKAMLGRRAPVERAPTARELELTELIRLAELRNASVAVDRDGLVSPTKPLPPNPMPMSRAIEQYRQGKLASGVQKLRTADDKQTLLTKLAAHVATAEPDLGPDPHVHEIDTHHLSAFLNVVACTNGRIRKKTLNPGAAAPKTMKKKLSDLSSFFEYAHSQLQATLVDPTVALDGRRKDLNTAAARKPRHYKPYSNEQLSLIFEPRQYLSFNRHADYFWAPLLALHLGARLGELVTLSLDAIKQQAGTGIWFLTIADEDAKNSNSQRTVPISQHLVRLGFISYVRHLRRIGATELFPHRNMTTPTALRLPSKNCSRQFHDYLEHLGLKDSDADLVFHSFRHSVVQALQDNGTPLSESMQLVGHLAQDHALKSGQLTAKGARSSHLTVYSHAGEVRLNVDNPLARLKGHLDRCIVLPLDYLRLRRAAYIVTSQTVVNANGKFKSGWSTLGKDAVGNLVRLK